jgi:hypothetical protein
MTTECPRSWREVDVAVVAGALRVAIRRHVQSCY